MTLPPSDVLSEVFEEEGLGAEANKLGERIGVRAGIRKTGSTIKYPGVVFVALSEDE